MNRLFRAAGRRRGAFLAFALVASFAPQQTAITRVDTPDGCVEPNRRITMYAEELPREKGRIRLGYGFTPETASIPGPTLEMYEGECLAITLVNDVPATTLAELRDDPFLGSDDPESLPLGVSLHVHGVKYTTQSDGTVHTGSFVPPGEARTYTWYAAPRVSVAGRVVSLGTAGYWWYHDHVAGTDHGTGGGASGLFGGLVVRRAGDFVPDRTYVIGMGPERTLNLRHYPATDCPPNVPPAPSNSCLVAERGERVEFLVIAFGDDFHTFHLHGHTWADNRTGILTSQLDETTVIDNKTVGPADTFGFQIIAGEEVGTGAWMLHCHVQRHSDKGMMTFFRVVTPGGLPLPTPAPLNGAHSHAH